MVGFNKYTCQDFTGFCENQNAMKLSIEICLI